MQIVEWNSSQQENAKVAISHLLNITAWNAPCIDNRTQMEYTIALIARYAGLARDLALVIGIVIPVVSVYVSKR